MRRLAACRRTNFEYFIERLGAGRHAHKADASNISADISPDPVWVSFMIVPISDGCSVLNRSVRRPPHETNERTARTSPKNG